jgi:hypothetical protein
MRKKRCRNSHITSMKNNNRSQPNEDPLNKSKDTVVKLDGTGGKETEGGQPENGIAVDSGVGKERDVGKSKVLCFLVIISCMFLQITVDINVSC